MGVQRKGLHEDVRKTRKRAKRPCRSAPAAPTGVTLTFGRREVKEREEWRARVRWDPVTQDVAGRDITDRIDAYQTQLRATNASGNPVELDSGQPAIWKHLLRGDDDHDVYAPIVRPRTWYYQTRVRAGIRVAGTICWSAWSPWTTPVQPATGALPGPPAPTGQTLTPIRDESRKGSPWVLKQQWNEVPQWTPPDGDPVEGAARYIVQLQVRRASDGVIVNTRRATVAARDDDANVTCDHVWGNITRKREYRSRVRPIDLYDRKGAWSAWTPWVRPPALTAPVTDLVLRHPKPRLYVATWGPPADPDGVIAYRVRWYRGTAPGVLVETQTVAGRRASYHVPAEDKGKRHYVEVRAVYEGSEEEGAAVTSADLLEEQTWSTPDVADSAIVEQTIMPGQITGDLLAGLLRVSSRIVSGDPGGARLEVDEGGLRLYDASGDILVSLPTDGDRPYVQADIAATALVALGATLLQDTTLARTASLVLERRVADPSSAPALSVGFPSSAQVRLRGDGTDPDAVYDWFGLAWDATGGPSQDTPTFWTARPGGAGYYRFVQEHRASNGAYLRSIVLPEPSVDDCWGIAVYSSGGTKYVAILYQKWLATSRYYLRRHRASDLSFVDEVEVTSRVVAPKPGLLTDGTDLYMVTTHGTGDATHLHLVRFSGSTLAYLATIDLDNAFTIGGGSGGGTAFESGGGVVVGGVLYLCLYTYANAPIARRGIYAFDWASKARRPYDDFAGQTGAEADGLAWDGSAFHSLVFNNPVVKHSDWVWTTESDRYWVAYTWRDSAGGYETGISPVAQVTMRRRAYLSVTWPQRPSGANQTRVYAERGSTQPATLRRQATTSGTSALLSAFNPAGAAQPSSNTFPGTGHGAELRTADGVPLVRATGLSRCRYVMGSGVMSPGDSADVTIAFGQAQMEVDTDGYNDPDNALFTAPFTGQYEVKCSVQWVANATGRRRLWAELSTDGGSTWSPIRGRGAADDRLPVAGASTTQSFSIMLSLAAGHKIRFRVSQNSGGALAVASATMSMVFLGPA